MKRRQEAGGLEGQGRQGRRGRRELGVGVGRTWVEGALGPGTELPGEGQGRSAVQGPGGCLGCPGHRAHRPGAPGPGHLGSRPASATY